MRSMSLGKVGGVVALATNWLFELSAPAPGAVAGAAKSAAVVEGAELVVSLFFGSLTCICLKKIEKFQLGIQLVIAIVIAVVMVMMSQIKSLHSNAFIQLAAAVAANSIQQLLIM